MALKERIHNGVARDRYAVCVYALSQKESRGEINPGWAERLYQKFRGDVEDGRLVLLSVAVMLMVGAYTAGQRAEHFKNGFWIALIAMGIGSLVTLGMMLALKIITVEARYIIPLAGMIISNSMNATAIAFNRIGSDLKSNKLAVETALSLGKNWKDASRRYYRNSVKAGMISILNFLKTVGLVALPGAMTGMILAGASPLDAVLIQLIVGYMLLLAVTISALISAEMSVRKFFNAAEQFVG